MIVLLACVAALLYFPRLRHAVGEFVWGALAFVVPRSVTVAFDWRGSRGSLSLSRASTSADAAAGTGLAACAFAQERAPYRRRPGGARQARLHR
jgi:hypothetical protein